MMLNLLTTIWFWLAFATSSNVAITTTATTTTTLWSTLKPVNSAFFELSAQKCSIDINTAFANLAWSRCLMNVLYNQGKPCIVVFFQVYYQGSVSIDGETTTEMYTTLTSEKFESPDKYMNDHCTLVPTQHQQLSCILDELSVVSCSADEPTQPHMMIVKAPIPILVGLNEFIGQIHEKNEEAGAGIIQPTFILALTLLCIMVDLI